MKVKIITLEIIFFKKQLAKKAVLKRLQQLFTVNSVQENLQCSFYVLHNRSPLFNELHNCDMKLGTNYVHLLIEDKHVDC